MVLGVAGALAGLVKVRYSHTYVDSQVFRFHYHWTAAFCFLACVFVTAADFVGDSILCLNGFEEAPKPITTFCWVSSTFTINTTMPGTKGIGTYFPEIHEKRIHGYYQWVPHVLFLQGILFYLPHLVWKSYEGKQVDQLLQGLNKSLFDEDEDQKKKNIIEYLSESWGLNNKYAFGYLGCEALNFANVLGQMFLMDRFLGGFFMDYGTKVIQFLFSDDKNRSDALYETFPRLAKCTFHQFGDSGDIKKLDFLCVLPQNIVNEKVFLVMWFWFVVLVTLTAIQLIWQLLVLYSPLLRLRLLESHLKGKLSPRAEQVVRGMHSGDFCLLEAIGRNLDPIAFKDVLHGITEAGHRYLASAPSMGTYRPRDPTAPPAERIYPTLPPS
ncbi:innexin inx3-like [Penaeus japonicus]|uniref:innexin inx3-like n=1 Tax=Penaeus japonicus TaxID=27405 RepID=UPI001C710236|nr:innexin inx3-like [Penaeus japonicus]